METVWSDHCILVYFSTHEYVQMSVSLSKSARTPGVSCCGSLLSHLQYTISHCHKHLPTGLDWFQIMSWRITPTINQSYIFLSPLPTHTHYFCTFYTFTQQIFRLPILKILQPSPGIVSLHPRHLSYITYTSMCINTSKEHNNQPAHDSYWFTTQMAPLPPP